MQSRQLQIEPYSFESALKLERELGVSHVLSQILVRRGFDHTDSARAWLAADEQHSYDQFKGVETAVELAVSHIAAGTRITVHGDYDVDGICATAVMVQSLKRCGASVDSFLPNRIDDGYGLSLETIEKLKTRGTKLLLTVDCGITAVEEVAAARAAGIDVIVTDHHMSRSDGLLPDAPIVHPAICSYPCEQLCGTGVAYKLAEALEDHLPVAGSAQEDLDLVALATIADVVSLVGENRRLVCEGLKALATTTKPGLRALMEVAQVDPSELDTRAVGFRLAPRINAAGRLYHADAGLELILTEESKRAEEIAAELHAANAERRDVERRILSEAETQARELGERPAYVLAGDGWHPGVIGIVAARIAERYYRPTVVVAFENQNPTAIGTGSGRSILAFDLLDGLSSCAERLESFGGHRAAAGVKVQRAQLEGFRKEFERAASAQLQPSDLVRSETADAIVSGDQIGLALAEELELLGPFGAGNPQPKLLMPAARLSEPQQMGEGKHLRFTVSNGGARARAVAFGVGTLPAPAQEPVDLLCSLERNQWNGVVEPRLLFQAVCQRDLADVTLVESDSPDAEHTPDSDAERELIDQRGRGIAGILADLVASDEPVLVVCADAERRLRVLSQIASGFELCSYAELKSSPELATGFTHLVALDPPLHEEHKQLLRDCPGSGFTHLVWGPQEEQFAQRVHELEYAAA